MDAVQTVTKEKSHTAYSVATDGAVAAHEIITELGDVDAGALQLFVSPALDATALARALTERFPDTPLIGCTTAGEFTQRAGGTGGASVMALPKRVVSRAGAVLADLSQGVEEGIKSAVGVLETGFGLPLSEADPDRYVGLLLVDGIHGDEELVNDVLGDLAPLLSFVGGSAGDDLAFTETHVFCGSQASTRGAALMLLDLAVPFTIVKTCSFRSTGKSFTATHVDEKQRIVWDLDGRPAADVYAEAVGVPTEQLDSKIFMSHPVGLMIDDDQPWIRSPQRVVGDSGIKFYCQILRNMRVELMVGTQMIDDTATALRKATAQVGGDPTGAIMFNCILRRMELDADRTHAEFRRTFQSIPTAGFHTYGESWLGHMNQTLTAIVFG